MKDETGRELDGMDEGGSAYSLFCNCLVSHACPDIFPVDHEQAGDIIDDQLYKALVEPLPPGCRLTVRLTLLHPFA